MLLRDNRVASFLSFIEKGLLCGVWRSNNKILLPEENARIFAPFTLTISSEQVEGKSERKKREREGTDRTRDKMREGKEEKEYTHPNKSQLYYADYILQLSTKDDPPQAPSSHSAPSYPSCSLALALSLSSLVQVWK